MTEDRALVDAVLTNVPGAFERLVARHQRLVWHVAWRMLGHREDALEISQETFMLVHRRLPQFRHEASLASWIGRIASNLATRRLQRRELPRQHAGADEDPDAPLLSVADTASLEGSHDQEQRSALLHRAIEALPALQRTAVTLYHLDELGIPEIAATLDMPENTVKSHLFRARKRLREVLALLEDRSP